MIVEFAFGNMNSLRGLKAAAAALKFWHSPFKRRKHSSTFNQCAALIQRIADAFNMASAIFNYSVRTNQMLDHSSFIAGM